MGIFEEIRTRGAECRITEEAFYAEVIREMETGIRRDGLWAKALSDSKMDPDKTKALYIKLRVQSLKDEVKILLKNTKEQVRLIETQEKNHERERADESLRKQREEAREQSAKINCYLGILASWYMDVLLGSQASCSSAYLLR